jgi:hypothetical protein
MKQDKQAEWIRNKEDNVQRAADVDILRDGCLHSNCCGLTA